MTDTPKQAFRMDTHRWRSAMDRARQDGTDLPTLLRQWIDDYIEHGEPSRTKVRYTAAELELAQRAVADLLPHTRSVIGAVVDAINRERE